LPAKTKNSQITGYFDKTAGIPRHAIQWRREGGASAPGSTVQEAAFGGTKIWNSEIWPLLLNTE